MIYTWTADDGSVIEQDLPMEKAPPLFSRRVVDGKVYVRRPVAVEPKVRKDRHFVAWSQEPVVNADGSLSGAWAPDTPYDPDPKSISYGLPVCDSWKDIENLKKQAKGGLTYGD